MDEARETYISVKARQRPPVDLSFADVDIGGVPGRVARPRGAADDRVLFYIDGGGYVGGGSGASKAEIGASRRLFEPSPTLPNTALRPNTRSRHRSTMCLAVIDGC